MGILAPSTLSIGVVAALLAGCGVLPLSPSKGQDDMQPPIGAPGAMSQVAIRPNSTNYKVVYSFSAAPNDGAEPIASLIDADGTLYGTTAYGGSYYCHGYPDYTCGTIFGVTPGGTEKLIHSFGKGTDGSSRRTADQGKG